MPRYSHVSHQETASCTTTLEGGRFCDAPSAPDMPFPICPRHALALYRRMHEMVTDAQVNWRDNLDVHHAMLDEIHARDNTDQHRVYYARIGEYIKIGVTTQLDKRIASYPPGTELLAVERGGMDLEARRHAQFRHLLVERKEWFRPEADLLEHIASLAA